MEPSALVPGHDQEILIIFEAGSDFVTSGNLILSGTNGISLIPPGGSEWRKDLEITLKACKPGEKQELSVHVRCGLIHNFSNESISQVDSFNSDHGLVAKVQTTYSRAQIQDNDDSNSPSMKGNLESFIPVLEKMALSVESVETIWLDPHDRFLLRILLTSNTPYHFSIDEWKVMLASPITIATGSNLNENFLKRTVSNGDQLSFVFECRTEKDSNHDLDILQETIMTLKLRDNTGKVFSIDLPLDLDEFYTSLSQLDTIKTMVVLATLKLEKNQALVGETVGMTFTLDTRNYLTSDVAKNFEGIGIAYSIDCEDSDWLVGGKVNGLIESSYSGKSFSCEIVAIPVMPGILQHYPIIRLELLTTSGNTIPINVECQQPGAFQSISMTQVNGIASPV